eukprot:6491734-Amphidinium_carterae.1
MSREEKELAKMRVWLGKVLRSKPAYITARQMYVKNVMLKRHAVNEKRRSEGRKDMISGRKAMTLHASHFKALPAEEVETLRASASVARASAERDQAAQVNTLLASIELKEEELEHVQLRSSMKVAQCALDGACWERLSELMSSMTNKAVVAKSVQDDACQCPHPLEQDEFDKVRESHKLPTSISVKACATLALICRGRSVFNKSVFGLQTAEGLFWVRTALLFQSPMLMLSVPLTHLPSSEWPEHFRSHGFRGTGMYDFKRVWKYDFEDVISHDVFAMASVTSVLVLLDTVIVPGCLVGSYSDPQNLQSVLEDLAPELVAEEKQPKKAAQTPRVPKHAPPPHPAASACPSASSCSHPHTSGVDPVGHDSDAEENEPEASADGPADTAAELWHDVFEELQEKKAEWKSEAESMHACFASYVQGGVWSIERSGRAVDSLRGFVRKDSEVYVFCKKFGLPLSASFAYTQFSADVSDKLMRLWQHRLVWLCQEWTSAGKPSGLGEVLQMQYDAPVELQMSRSLCGANAWKRYQSYLTMGL